MTFKRKRNASLKRRIRVLDNLGRTTFPPVKKPKKPHPVWNITNLFLLVTAALSIYLFIQLDISYEEEVKARALQALVQEVGSPKTAPVFEFKTNSGESPAVADLMSAQNLTFLDVDIESLVDLNSDVRGWLRVPNTSIDYAFAQGVYNDFYLRRDLNKRVTVTGWVFLDSANSSKVDDFNSLIYAHNRGDDVMFGGLKALLNVGYYEDPANYFIHITTPEEHRVYRIVSVYTTKDHNVNYQIISGSDEDKQRFITHAKDKNTIPALHDSTLTVSDTYVTLSTCHGLTGTSTRLVVHARLDYRTERQGRQEP